MKKILLFTVALLATSFFYQNVHAETYEQCRERIMRPIAFQGFGKSSYAEEQLEINCGYLLNPPSTPSTSPTSQYSSGACSGHNGVNCSAGAASDGSVICNDGWIDSTVFYYNVDLCKTKNVYDSSAKKNAMDYIEIATIYLENINTLINTAKIDGIMTEKEYSEIIAYINETDRRMKSSRDSYESLKANGTDIQKIWARSIFNSYDIYVNYNSKQKTEAYNLLVESQTKVVKVKSAIYNDFTDIAESHRNINAIRYLKKKNIIGGYSDGTFKPNKTVNRAELMKILIGKNLPNGTYGNCFKDVKQEWFAPYVCYAKQQGWVQGYANGTFKPAQIVNRAEAIKMAIEVFDIDLPSIIVDNPFPDINKGQWYAKYVQVAKDSGLFDSNIRFYQPTGGMKRANISEIIYRLLAIKKLQVNKYNKSLDDLMLNK